MAPIRFPWWQSKNRFAIGIDCGPSAVKLVLLAKAAPPLWIAAAVRPLAAGIVDGAGIRKPEALGNILAELREELGIAPRAAEAAMALPDGAAIQRLVEVPAELTRSEFEANLYEIVERLTPFPAEEMQFDWQVMKRIGDKEQVLVVAARRERIEAYERCAEQAGLSLICLEVESFALYRAVSFFYPELLPQSAGDTIAILDIGASSMLLTVWDAEGVKRFERAQPIEAARELQHAMAATSLPMQEEDPEFGEDASGAESPVEQLAEEILFLLRYSSSSQQSGIEQMKHLILAGGGAVQTRLQEAIATRVGFAVQRFARLQLPGVEEKEARLALAAGLALRAAQADGC